MTDPTTTPQTPEEQPIAAAPVAPEAAPVAPVAPEAAPVAPPAAPAAQPNPYATQQSPYAAPANAYAAPAAGYAPAAPVKQTLSLIAFIAGIIGVLLGFAGMGLLISIAAVVLGMMGKKREPQAPKWMWLTGVITGWAGIALNAIMFVVLIVLPIIFVLSFGAVATSY